MNSVYEAKKKAIEQILRNIAETGQPTCNQILFLQLFFNEEIKEKK